MSVSLVPPPPAAATLLDGVSIVLPCHDEEANVAAAVRMAVRAGWRCARAYEVIVVDDGSRDATLAVATRLAAEDPTVRVIVHPDNRGYGAALRSGIAAARQPWVLLTDADLQFDLVELMEFVPFTDDHDLLVGYRMERRDPVGRRLAASAWNRLVHAAFRLPVRDVDCAFKLVRRDLLDPLELEASGAMISTELVLRCLSRGARMRELGVHHHPRTAGRQSGTRPRVVARALRELARLRRRLGPLPA